MDHGHYPHIDILYIIPLAHFINSLCWLFYWSAQLELKNTLKIDMLILKFLCRLRWLIYDPKPVLSHSLFPFLMQWVGCQPATDIGCRFCHQKSELGISRLRLLKLSWGRKVTGSGVFFKVF